jgi:hypothetical protein
MAGKIVGRIWRVLISVLAISLLVFCSDSSDPELKSTPSSLPDEATVYAIAFGNDGRVIVGTGVHGLFVGELNGRDFKVTQDLSSDSEALLGPGVIRDVVWRDNEVLVVGAMGLTVFRDEGDGLSAIARYDESTNPALRGKNVTTVAQYGDLLLVGASPGGVTAGTLIAGSLQDVTYYHPNSTPYLVEPRVTGIALDSTGSTAVISGHLGAGLDIAQLTNGEPTFASITTLNNGVPQGGNMVNDVAITGHTVVAVGLGGVVIGTLRDGRLVINNHYDHRNLNALTGSPVARVAISPDGQMVALGEVSGYVIVARLTEELSLVDVTQYRHKPSNGGLPVQLHAVAFTPDGSTVLRGLSRNGLDFINIE